RRPGRFFAVSGHFAFTQGRQNAQKLQKRILQRLCLCKNATFETMGAILFSRVGLLMNGLPTVAHKPSSDEYPRTRACGAAGDVLGRAEAAACLHVAGRSRQHGPSLEAGPLRWRPAGRPLWLADGPAWRVDGLASRPGAPVWRVGAPASLGGKPRRPLVWPSDALAVLAGAPKHAPLWLADGSLAHADGPTPRPLWPADASAARVDAPPWRPAEPLALG